MNNFDKQYQRQGGRCQWCQHLVPIAAMTREHIHPKIDGQRERNGSDYVLACFGCNQGRAGLTIGSLRFERWLRRVINYGKNYRFIRRETFLHNAT